MGVLIREFQAGEERQIQKIGLSAFKSMEGLFISKPRTAKVAVADGEIAGAMYYEIFHYGKKSFCYLNYAFVAPKFQGKGIGKKLYQETIEYVRSKGCEVITALVKGDNVGSFGLIERCGLRKCSIPELVKQIGIKGVSLLFLRTEASVASGMDLYSTGVKEKKGNGKELTTYFVINLLLLLLSYWNRKTEYAIFLCAAMSVLAFSVLTGSLINLISKQKWHFRLNNCGLLISVVITALGGIFPMIGRWYPDKYSLEKPARRELCISALLEWYGLFLARILIALLSPDQGYWKATGMVVDMILVYRLVPTYPFSEFGANRVWKYNKIFYGVNFLITAILLYFL